MHWTPTDLLSPPTIPTTSDAETWREELASLEPADPMSLAVVGGTRAASVGWAFAFGYQAALRALLPDLARGHVMALCATEADGNHPRSIETTLEHGVLTGTKTFVSMGPLADRLLVVACSGPPVDGRPCLAACVVGAATSGVTVKAMPALPMVPDIPHGELLLDGAVPLRVLPDDGYVAVLKRFRTIEDIHVHAALTAWLLAAGHRLSWPAPLVEEGLVALAALDHAARLSPDAPATHRLLGGALTQVQLMVERAEPHWEAAPAPLRQMWQRDRVLMRIARGARQKRLQRARDGSPPVSSRSS